MSVSVATGGGTGRTGRQLVFETNDPSNAQMKVNCSGMVQGAFKNMPSALNFGLIDPDSKEVSQTVSIIRGEGGPIAPKLMHAQLPGLTADIKEVRPGEHYEMTARLTMPLALGNLNGILMLETGVPEAPNEAVRILGTVSKRVQVIPEALRLPAKIRGATNRTAVVLWHGSATSKILSATCTDPKLEASIVIQGRSQEVHLKAPNGYELPSEPPTVVIKTSDPAKAELRVQVLLEEEKPAADKKTP